MKHTTPDLGPLFSRREPFRADVLRETLGQPDPKADDATIDARFAEFDEAHPEVWKAFVGFANDLINAGYTHGSAEMIYQRIRWETALNAERDGGWKLNDHFRSRYARKLAAADSRFSEFFEFRRGKC
jgi:hypothetical protein